MGSLETLGSLAQAVSDRMLRENVRRIMEGFRTCHTGEGADHLAPLPGSLEPGGHVTVDSTRSISGSRSRQGSGSLRRRSGSYNKPQRSAGKPDLASEGRAPSLHAIYASTSLGRALPVTPRRWTKRGSRSLPKLLTAAACAALLILALCLLLGRWLPEQGAETDEAVSPRRQLSADNLSGLPEDMRHGLQLQGSGKVDMYEAAGAGNKGKHSRERGRWGQHMSSHFSRSLAEGDIGSVASVATAQAPDVAPLTTTTSSSSAPSSSGSTSGSSGALPTGETLNSGPPLTSTAGGGSSANAGTASESFSGADRSPAAYQEKALESVASPGAEYGTAGGVSFLAGVGGGGSAGAITVLQQPQGGDAAVSNGAGTQQGAYDSSGDATAVSNAAGTMQDGADQNGNGDQGGVLQYSGGYANVTSEAYEAVPHTQTWQQCAAACASDGKCLAWTRVAGGSADVQTCYLKSSVGAVASSVQRGASTRMPQSTAAVQYEDSIVLLESGTHYRDALPDALYGCPYPPVAGSNGECTPPAACNCYNGICYGQC